VRLIDAAGNYFQYQYYQGGNPLDVLNDAIGSWKAYDIPLNASAAATDGWRRTASGTPDLGRITALEIHSDTWGYDGFNLWVDDVGFHTTQPRVISATVNSGAAERSMVTSLTATFRTIVSLDAGAFSLQRIGGAAVTLNQSGSVVGGRTVAVLTFTGPGVTAGSLDDGTYTLTVSSARVRDQQGIVLDGDGDGVAGGDYHLQLHRLYGDANGDGTVNGLDLALFRSAFGTTAGTPGYLNYLDFNGDGRVDVLDLVAFRSRFGVILP
jgi:hypothetical protein